MACDCIRLRIAYKPSESSLWVEGIINLTSLNITGTFTNGQPYWQFVSNQVWPQGFSGPLIEVSQLNGTGAWKIYAIDSVPSSPNSGVELLSQNLLVTPSFCPEFLPYGDKVFNNYIFNSNGFEQTLISGDEWIARTECCINEDGDFYVYIDNGAGKIYSLLQDPTGDLAGTPYWQFEPLIIDTNLPSGVFLQLSRGTDGLGNWAFYIIPAIQNPTLATDIWYQFNDNPSFPGVYPSYPNELNGTSNFWQKYTVSGFSDVEFGITIALCEPPTCVNHEDRHEQEFKSIKLPKPFTEQNRGWKDCCVCSPMLTLASLTDSESWKNDVTSAWIKLSDPTDVVSFQLYKNNVLTTYTPTLVSFPNESDAYYTTIQWKDVLASDGIGCFELRVSYDISGVTGNYVWGSYNLREYSIQNALKTARIRVKFNLQQEIEGINFTNANVEDCIRFNGFIGERQPNTEIDNLIYQNREVKTVVRENLNKYTITTDPSEECLITKLTDLYLLSENEMFISDYNAHNHSYKYLDLPVIVEESPEIDYLDILQRKAKLTCVVGDRRKNKRTFY